MPKEERVPSHPSPEEESLTLYDRQDGVDRLALKDPTMLPGYNSQGVRLLTFLATPFDGWVRRVERPINGDVPPVGTQ